MRPPTTTTISTVTSVLTTAQRPGRGDGERGGGREGEHHRDDRHEALASLARRLVVVARLAPSRAFNDVQAVALLKDLAGGRQRREDDEDDPDDDHAAPLGAS